MAFGGFVELIICLVLVRTVSGNKYAKEANAPSSAFDDSDKSVGEASFRVQRLNFVWSKAARKLETSDQKKLYHNLQKLDKQFLAAKYERDGGGDSEGILAKDVERELEKLLNKFGLATIYEALSSGGSDKRIDGSLTNGRNDAPVGNPSKPPEFKDPKLRRLWLDAVAVGGFDENELAALEEEFQHHQSKLDEYGKLTASGKKKLSSDEKQNSVLQEDFDADPKLHANAEMKQKFKNIQRDYDSLKTKVATKAQSRKTKSDTPLGHPRVLQLLEKARSLYSGAELESIEEELRHFEGRLKKLEYLEREATRGKTADHIDQPSKAKKEKSAKIYDREVVEQLSDYSRKVEKYERYLASKLEL